MRINFAFGYALDSTLAYNITAVGFAILVGLTIYSIVIGFQYMHAEALLMRDEIQFASKAIRRRVEAKLGLRLFLQIASVLSLILYSAFFFNAILPYSLSLMSPVNPDTAHQAGWLESIAILFVALHIFCIFIRLLVLRPRLFTSADTFKKN